MAYFPRLQACIQACTARVSSPSLFPIHRAAAIVYYGGAIPSGTQSMDPLLDVLGRVRRRLLLVRAAEAGLYSAIGGAAAAGALSRLRILVPRWAAAIGADHAAMPLLLIPILFAVGFFGRLLGGVSLREAARVADHAAGLKERLATALEVLPGTCPDFGQAPRPSPGLLDERLLSQARQVASQLDVAHLSVERCWPRRVRILLASVLALLVAAFIPSIGGPPLAPADARRAAAMVEQAAQSPGIAPAVRAEIQRALAKLQAAGATRGDADQATAGVYRAAQGMEARRQGAGRILNKIESAEVQAIIRAAKGGDGAGAAAAAESAADKVGSEPGSGGMPMAEREKLTDSLTGAAIEAQHADLAALKENLDRAAAAVKKADRGAAADAFKGLASAATEALGEGAAGGVPALVSAAQGARRELGLPELPPAGLAGETSVARGAAAEPGTSGTSPGAGETSGTRLTGAGGAAFTVPPDVKPEDREVVRRYFGG